MSRRKPKSVALTTPPKDVFIVLISDLTYCMYIIFNGLENKPPFDDEV